MVPTTPVTDETAVVTSDAALHRSVAVTKTAATTARPAITTQNPYLRRKPPGSVPAIPFFMASFSDPVPLPIGGCFFRCHASRPGPPP